MLIVGDKLDQARLVWLQWLAGGSDDLKVGCERRLWREGADLPG